MPPKERESEIVQLDEFALEILKSEVSAPALSPLNSFLMDQINSVGCDDQDEQAESGLVLSGDLVHMLDELGPVNKPADLVIEWQALSQDDLVLLEKAIGIQDQSDTTIQDRVGGMLEIWKAKQSRIKAGKTSQATKTHTQREIDAYRAGAGRDDYNEYQRTLYAAKVEATEGRTVRTYGEPDDETKLAKRREQNRLAAVASRAKAKAR